MTDCVECADLRLDVDIPAELNSLRQKNSNLKTGVIVFAVIAGVITGLWLLDKHLQNTRIQPSLNKKS